MIRLGHVGSRFKPSKFIRTTGFIVVAAAMLSTLFYSSKQSLAALDLAQFSARNKAIASPLPGGSIYVSVTVRIPANSSQAAPQVRAGVSYDGQIAYWQDASPAKSASSSDQSDAFHTIVASRLAGDIIIAVGPLATGSASISAAHSTRDSVIEIEGQPYVIVGHKSVENLVEMKSRASSVTTFSESTLGLFGEIELRPAH